MLLEVRSRVVSALADALSVHGEPCPALLNDVDVRRHVENLPGPAYALSVKNVEFDFSKRRSELIFDHFDASPVTNHDRVLAGCDGLLDGADSAYVQAYGRIELE